MKNPEAGELRDIFFELRAMHSGLDPIDAQIAQLRQERRQVVDSTAQVLGERVLNRTVQVVKTGEVENDFTIARYEVMNPTTVPRGRTMPGYIRPIYAIPRKSSMDLDEAEGKVIALDLDRNSLILKPKSLRKSGLGFARYWVRMTDDLGNPVIDINYLDK